jgi:hypothetical protein
MPQIVLLAALGAGVYAGYRALRAVGDQVRESLARAEADARARSGATVTERDLGRLEYDPISGTYRPRRDA